MSTPVLWDADEPVLRPSAAPRVVIAAERCKGCGLCVAVCPPRVLGLGPLNEKGFPAAVLLDDARCTSCAACALLCPDGAITVFRPRRRAPAAA